MNLHLRVGTPDGSGYHPLMTWMVSVGLFDNLSFTVGSESKWPSDLGRPDTVRGAAAENAGPVLTCDDPSLPLDLGNLVLRGIACVARHRPELAGEGGREFSRLRVHLSKRIPIGSGLGGGSSDAAATLLAINELHDLDLGPGLLQQMAAELGSDVPFFLHLPSAMARGRGEIIQRVPPPRAACAVLILPRLSIATALAYRVLDDRRPDAPADVLEPIDVATWSGLSSTDLLPRLVNDLESAAFAIKPKLAELQSAARSVAGRPVRMSGSGSTLFTLTDDPEEGRSIVAKLSDHIGVRCVAVPVGTDTIDLVTHTTSSTDVQHPDRAPE